MALTKPVKFIPNIEMPMRDGTILRADMFRPDDGDAHPVILGRSPYNKQLYDPYRPWQLFADRGYIVLVQDCRGRNASEGVFYPFIDEMQDGYDSVEWAASQKWSTGSVGMFGTSYLGVTQWMAAAAAPPHLKTIIPSFTSCDYHNGWIYQNGALLRAFSLIWGLGSFIGDALAKAKLPPEEKKRIAEEVGTLMSDEKALMERMPLEDMPVLSKHGLAPYYADYLAHPDGDDYWERWNLANYHNKIQVPIFSMGGWYDMFLGATFQNYHGMVKNGGSKLARENQKLVIGAWAHNRPQFSSNPYPDISFGPKVGGGAIDLDGQSVRWFDRWLKGIENGIDREPKLTIFTTGRNAWQNPPSWPLPNTQYTNFYFHSRGRANSRHGDGVLSPTAPSDEPQDTYIYDPRNPVPTRGGGAFLFGGAWEQEHIEERTDILVYTSAPLPEDLEVTGPVSVTFWAASTAKDTDFTAKLTDVFPDGLSMNIADNIIRARYREGLTKQKFIQPGEVYEYTIDLYSISNLFKKGHRIRLDISSSNFPRFDRNPNTGTVISKETELRPAMQTIFHSAKHPSHIRLPVIKR